MQEKIKSNFVALDGFSSEVKFNFGKGATSFKTKLGALFSIAIYSMVVIYGSKRFEKFYQKGDTIIFESLQKDEISTSYEFGGK